METPAWSRPWRAGQRPTVNPSWPHRVGAIERWTSSVVCHVALRHPQSMKMRASAEERLLLKTQHLAPLFRAGCIPRLRDYSRLGPCRGHIKGQLSAEAQNYRPCRSTIPRRCVQVSGHQNRRVDQREGRQGRGREHGPCLQILKAAVRSRTSR